MIRINPNPLPTGARFGFIRCGGPNRDRTDDLTDANRTLSQLSYRPILPLFAGFCNKKLIFKFSDFRRIQRKTSPKSWTETRRSMCDHRDANRTLSQLSYKPVFTCVPHYYTHSPRKSKRNFCASRIISWSKCRYQFYVFYLCLFCDILFSVARLRCL